MNLNGTLSDSSRARGSLEETEVPQTNEIADEKFEEVVVRLKTAMINHPDFIRTLRSILEPLQGIERFDDTLYSLDILNEAEQTIKNRSRK